MLKFQVRLRPDMEPKVMLGGVDITQEVLGLELGWEKGKIAFAKVHVAVESADVDIFADAVKVPHVLGGPPAQEAPAPAAGAPPAIDPNAPLDGPNRTGEPNNADGTPRVH